MTRVEGTNDYSIVSKLSAAKAEYFKDEFLQEFVEKPRNRAPLINWGYYIRSKSIELTFEAAVKHFADRDLPFQILSIGAGFDTTFFNIQEKYEPKNMVFFEIDLPSNVERKVKLIFNSEKCQSLVWDKVMFENDGKTINTDRYRLFACDLADTGQLKKSLEKLNFDFSKPTLILSECVITYMKEKDSTKLIQFLGEILDNAAFFVYEQCEPDDAFGAFMVKHFQNISSPILGLSRFRTQEDQISRYLAAGWCKCKVHSLTSVFLCLPEQEIQRIQDLELFDEFEEFFLKCSHYFMLVATKGICDILHGVLNLKLLPALPEILPEDKNHLQVQIVDTPNSLKRFGHSMGVGEDVYVFGGFGEENGKHKRLGNFVRIEFKGDHFIEKKLVKNANFERLYASCEVWKGQCLLFGGRQSPQKAFQDMIAIDRKSGNLVKTYKVDQIEGRWRHATCILQDYLVIVGGRNEDNTFRSVIFFHLVDESVIEQNLEVPLVSCTVCPWGSDKVVIAGGQNPTCSGSGAWSSLQETIWVLTLKGKSVKTKKVVLDLEPRFGHTAHIIRNHLVLVGGVGPYGPLGLDVVNLISGEVMKYSLPSFDGVKESDLVMLHNHTSFVKDESLIIIGGGGNCFSFGTHINSAVTIRTKTFIPLD